MKLSSLIEGLERAGADVDAFAILDAIWLARQERSFEHAPMPKAEVPPPESLAESNVGAMTQASAGQTPEPSGPPDPPGRPTNPEPSAVEAFPAADPFGKGRKASGFTTLAAAPLFDALAFQRSLRWFRARAPSRDGVIVDEEATARRSAEMSVGGSLRILPVAEAARERWFRADLVVEDDASVELWREALDGFAQTLTNSGAFLDVRQWRLDLGSGAAGPARLRSRAGAVLPTSALALGERRLIVFASHGASAHWSSGAYAKLLIGWAQSASVALVHLLPAAQWARTALGQATGVVTTDHPGVANAKLEFKPFWGLHGDVEVVTPFPLLEFSPEAVGEWAAMLMARGRPSPATSLSPLAREITPRAVASEESEAVIRQRVGALLSTAPRAFRLATFLSQSPFTVPVARLIQEAHFGRSDHQDLVRLFVSGLLRLQPGQTRRASSSWFMIHPEAIKVLTPSVVPEELEAAGVAMMKRVSDHIANATGARPTMTSFRLDKHGDNALPDWAMPFARVAAQLAFTSTTRRPASSSSAESATIQRIRGLKPRLAARLSRLAASKGPLVPSETSDEEWGVILDRALTEIDDQGRRRFTPGALAELERIAKAQPLLGARLLWVDDQPSGNERFAELMTAQGAKVVCAESTRAAMEMMDERFNVIISDMARVEGEREGFVLLQRLRDAGFSTPVVIFAARFASVRANRAAVVRAGAFFCTNDVNALLRHVVRLYAKPNEPAEEMFDSDEHLVASAADASSRGDRPFAMERQQQSEWSWCATALSIAKFLDPTVKTTQCELANRVLGRTDCCTPAGQNFCNVPGTLEGPLAILGVAFTVTPSGLSQAQVVERLLKGEIIPYRIGWNGGGGHFRVISGFRETRGEVFLEIEDSVYGPSLVSFEQMTMSPAYHNWTHTFRVSSAPADAASKAQRDGSGHPSESIAGSALDDYACVVAVRQYRELPPLPYAERDAGTFIKWLRSPTGGGVSMDRMRFVLSPVSSFEIDAQIDKLIDRPRPTGSRSRIGRRFYLYLAGRGARTPDGLSMLLLTGTMSDEEDQGVVGSQYAKALASMDLFEEVVLIMDCAVDGAVLRQSPGPPLFKRLARYEAAPARRLSIYGPGEERSESEMSSFTQTLIDALSGGGFQPNGDLTVNSLSSFITVWEERRRGVGSRTKFEASPSDWVLARRTPDFAPANFSASQIFVGAEVVIDGRPSVPATLSWSSPLSAGTHVIELPAAGVRCTFKHSHHDDFGAVVQLTWELRGRAVLVAGTGRYTLNEAELWMSQALGSALALAGFSLVTGGWPGVDHVVAAAYARKVSEESISSELWLTQVIEPRGKADFEGGRVVRSDVFPGDMVEAVVLVGGVGGTLDAYRQARQAGKRIYPIPATGGDAFEAFNEMVRDPTERGRLRGLDADIDSQEAAHRVARSLVERLLFDVATPEHVDGDGGPVSA